MEECVFCKIARGEIPADVVLETEDFLAFRDVNPKAPVHVLVIPREHLTSVNGVVGWSPELTQELLRMVVQAAEETGVVDSGYRIVSNAGPDAGQEVEHLHIHVLGGKPLGGFW